MFSLLPPHSYIVNVHHRIVQRSNIAGCAKGEGESRQPIVATTLQISCPYTGIRIELLRYYQG